jgi:hypothetical protein
VDVGVGLGEDDRVRKIDSIILVLEPYPRPHPHTAISVLHSHNKNAFECPSNMQYVEMIR